MSEQIPSPLSLANPKSLDELFSSDPDDLEKKDFELVIKEMRAQAARWAAAEAAGKRTVKQPKLTAPVNLSLDDLGII